MRIRMLILGACLTLASTVSTAEIYKWTDEQGNTHYGDRQPQGTSAERVNVRSGQPLNPVPMATARENTGDESENGSDQQNQNGLTPEQRQENCEVASQNLKTIQTNSRIQINEDGERRYLTPEEIEAKEKEMKELTARYCVDEPAGGNRNREALL